MHAEDAGRGGHRQFSHVIQELTVLADRRYIIKAAGIEQIFPISHDHVFVIESRQDRVQGPSVPLVGHATAVIALALKKGIKKHADENLLFIRGLSMPRIYFFLTFHMFLQFVVSNID